MAIGLPILLIISIIPLIIAGFYAHPIADDFTNASKLSPVVKSGGHLLDILVAGFKFMKWKYFNWQGIYAAAFFTSFTPLSFSENLYVLTPILSLSSLIGSTYFFINTLFKALGFERKYGIVLSSIILLFSIQFVVDKHQAIYWFPAFSNYTIFYAFSLVLFSLLIKLWSRTSPWPWFDFVVSCLMAIMIGGGNFSTSLMTLILLSMAIVFVWKFKQKLLPQFLVVYALLLGGFIISVIAPGNSIRASYFTGMSAPKAIFQSVRYSMLYVEEWTGLSQLAGFVCIAVIALVLTKRLRFQFRYPLLVGVVSFLVFASQFTPPFYAMGHVGPGRLQDIIYYSYYLLLSFVIFYFCGWLNQRKLMTIHIAKITKRDVVVGGGLLLALFTIGVVGFGTRNLFFVDTLRALKQGTLQTYHREYLERVASIKSGQTTISEIDTVPDFFSPLRISEDPKHWRNINMSKYFQVDEIRLKDE